MCTAKRIRFYSDDQFYPTRWRVRVNDVGPIHMCVSFCRLPFSYRSTSNVKLPLRVIPTINEVGTTQVTYLIVLKTNFGNKLSATNVILRIPTPLNTTSVDCKVQMGKAKYVPEENVVVWK